jgi:hypothetical protein
MMKCHYTKKKLQKLFDSTFTRNHNERFFRKRRAKRKAKRKAIETLEEPKVDEF